MLRNSLYTSTRRTGAARSQSAPSSCIFHFWQLMARSIHKLEAYVYPRLNPCNAWILQHDCASMHSGLLIFMQANQTIKYLSKSCVVMQYRTVQLPGDVKCVHTYLSQPNRCSFRLRSRLDIHHKWDRQTLPPFGALRPSCGNVVLKLESVAHRLSMDALKNRNIAGHSVTKNVNRVTLSCNLPALRLCYCHGLTWLPLGSQGRSCFLHRPT